VKLSVSGDKLSYTPRPFAVADATGLVVENRQTLYSAVLCRCKEGRIGSLAKEVGSTTDSELGPRVEIVTWASKRRRIDGLTRDAGFVGSFWVFGAREIWRTGSEGRYRDESRAWKQFSHTHARRWGMSDGGGFFWLVILVRNSKPTSLPTWDRFLVFETLYQGALTPAGAMVVKC
jgi:hypothetical protein